MAPGYSQKQGTKIGQIFPIKYDTLGVFLAWMASQQIKMVLVNKKSSLLNGNYQEEFDMAQRKGFIQAGQEGKIMRLH